MLPMTRFKRVPLDELQMPKDGHYVIAEHWWEVTPENEVLFFDELYPQCNTNRSIVLSHAREGHTAVFVPFAYVVQPAE